ncbi:hypothetical protein PN462_00340 [Spirulina sp. CS-785/01]|uniref:hypothetical protein n=1 Tax=Spirulina sp. CS-785/01 TaxID=3021716 RepID=UPI00232C0AA4|nr:hypothetical protein [Spirulina sp. CS-785/01]MDB9311530.1 hypothetical protein [Spirulina sp. CS-785/01]
MKIIKTKGIIENGQVKATLNEDCSDSEVDVIVVAKDEPDEFDQRYQMMIEKGYDTPEKVHQLIQQVKLEMLKEKGRA